MDVPGGGGIVAPDAPDGGAHPDSMEAQMAAIRAACRGLSDIHRLAMPAEVVGARVTDLAQANEDLFGAHVVRICFLLDQQRVLRFNELHTALEGASSRTVSAKLELLQARGLVERRSYDENPPRVEYRLTTRGRDFTDLLFPALVHVDQTAGGEPSP